MKSDNKKIELEELKKITKSFIGKYYQKPPLFSAVKKDGKKLYEYARKNIDIDVEAKEVEIFDFKILKAINENEFLFSTSVSKGTYIRSLIVDVAEKINTYGALKTLKRTTIGNFLLEDSIEIEETSSEKIISVEQLFASNHKLILDDYLIKLVKNGVILDERQIKTEAFFLVYNQGKKLIALYYPYEQFKYKPLIIFKEEDE